MTCDAKCLVWAAWFATDPAGVPGIALCESTHEVRVSHPGNKGIARNDRIHNGRLDHEVATIDGGTNRPHFTWLESDRRTFRGDLDMCPWSSLTDQDRAVGARCVLPAGHAGNHAL